MITRIISNDGVRMVCVDSDRCELSAEHEILFATTVFSRAPIGTFETVDKCKDMLKTVALKLGTEPVIDLSATGLIDTRKENQVPTKISSRKKTAAK